MGKMLYSCAEATRLLSDSMDRSLPLWAGLRLRGHLLFCRFCDRYRRQLLFLRRALRCLPDAQVDSSPDALPPESKERLKRLLAERSGR